MFLIQTQVLKEPPSFIHAFGRGRGAQTRSEVTIVVQTNGIAKYPIAGIYISMAEEFNDFCPWVAEQEVG